MFSKNKANNSHSTGAGMKTEYKDKIEKIREKLAQADVVILGAGAGLSTSAGFVYNGMRFQHYFGDFAEKYGFSDMYSGGFHPYKTLEEHWAYWSRYIYVNRYMDAPKTVYSDVLQLVQDKDYFVLTTNVDHCFQKAGFDKNRLFYTQGDYGLFQCSKPCHKETYDNEEMIRKMVLSQGYAMEQGDLVAPEGRAVRMQIPSDLVPKCPKCGRPMSMNLRADSTFVQDAGWDMAAKRYEDFLRASQNKKVVFLELGVGYNTPGIIKYPFWQYTYNWKDAYYVCINKGQADIPPEIRDKAIGVDADIAGAIEDIKKIV